MMPNDQGSSGRVVCDATQRPIVLVRCCAAASSQSLRAPSARPAICGPSASSSADCSSSDFGFSLCALLVAVSTLLRLLLTEPPPKEPSNPRAALSAPPPLLVFAGSDF